MGIIIGTGAPAEAPKVEKTAYGAEVVAVTESPAEVQASVKQKSARGRKRKEARP